MCPVERNRRRKGGFTLIELLAVLVMLAVLASMAAPVAQLAVKRQKEQELRYHLRQIREAIDQYKKLADEGRIAKTIGETGYPRTLDELVDGVVDQKSPERSKIYLLRHLPTDPWAPEGVFGAASWGKRSYASPHDEPREGKDVYDVFSRSDETGLNGLPYRRW